MRDAPVVLRAAFALLALAAGQIALAQRSGGSAPDLVETWARRGCTGGQPCPFIPTELPLKARAIGFIQAFDEALGPKYDCAQATMPSLVIDPYNFTINDKSNQWQWGASATDPSIQPAPNSRAVSGPTMNTAIWNSMPLTTCARIR